MARKKTIKTETVTPVIPTQDVPPTVRKVLIQNITFGDLAFPEFSLVINATAVVEYTKAVKNYAAQKFIKILRII